MLLEMGREMTPERMKRQSQSKNNTQLWMWLMMEVKSGAVKSNTVYEPGMLGPWIKVNWKWSSQRLQEWTSTFLESVKLKGTGMDEFNSGDHYTYYCGQESLRRNRVAIIVNKRVWNGVLGCNLKNDRIISVPFQGKLFKITVIQVYAPTNNA